MNGTECLDLSSSEWKGFFVFFWLFFSGLPDEPKSNRGEVSSRILKITVMENKMQDQLNIPAYSTYHNNFSYFFPPLRNIFIFFESLNRLARVF